MILNVKTHTGAVEGLPGAYPMVAAFKGIPYARPPIGELRWAPPQPAAPWEGVFKAYAFGPAPMQNTKRPPMLQNPKTPESPNLPYMSEDCLHLNIWTPAVSPEDKLPVFVWFFGGGHVTGHTAQFDLDGCQLARRGIVVVTVDYRVNVFGFIAHRELTGQQPEAPSNFGYLDMKAALQWVGENIGGFGGDPENITIGGHSSGGLSVAAMMTSPQTEGLFHKAILMSGLYSPGYVIAPQFIPHTFEEDEQAGAELFKLLGVSTLAQARALPAEYINDIASGMGDRITRYNPVWDGKFLLEAPMKALSLGRRRRVPFMIGSTTGEKSVVVPCSSMAEYESFADRRFGSRAEEFRRLCDSDTLDGVLSKSCYSAIEAGVHQILEAEKQKDDSAPVYMYISDVDMPGPDRPGAYHGSDIWYFWGNLGNSWRPFTGAHYDVSRRMCNYWANFMKTGDPNGADCTGEPLPAWQPYSLEAPWHMEFGPHIHMDESGIDDITRFMVDEGFTDY